jgi:hypothetical protein
LEYEAPRRTHLPPADVQALPVADDEDVHPDRIAPSTKNGQGWPKRARYPIETRARVASPRVHSYPGDHADEL